MALSKRRAARRSGPSFSWPVVAAASVTTSCTHRIHGMRCAFAKTIAGAVAGKHGVVAMTTSALGSSGATRLCTVTNDASWRSR